MNLASSDTLACVFSFRFAICVNLLAFFASFCFFRLSLSLSLTMFARAIQSPEPGPATSKTELGTDIVIGVVLAIANVFVYGAFSAALARAKVHRMLCGTCCCWLLSIGVFSLFSF